VALHARLDVLRRRIECFAEAHLLAARAGEPGPHADAVSEFADPRGARLYNDLLAARDDRALRDRSA
jgi:hypothetical protein